MKRLASLLCMAATLALMGCGASLQTAAYTDDLYGTHNRMEVAARQKAEAEARRAEAEAREAQYQAMLATMKADAAKSDYEAYRGGGDAALSNSYSSVLADTYESAYARRLYGFSSSTYRMPSSVATVRYTDAFHYASAYDPAFYNIMVSGDVVWVEPKYITSMFGTWGATPVPAYGWYYGWGTPYNWWRPYRSWFDVYWSMGIWGMYGFYDPFWGWGYPYPPYYYGPYPGHPGGAPHHHHHPPHIVHRNPSAMPPSSRGGNFAPSSRGGGNVRSTGIYGRPASSPAERTRTTRPSGGVQRNPGSTTTYRSSGSATTNTFHGGAASRPSYSGSSRGYGGNSRGR